MGTTHLLGILSNRWKAAQKAEREYWHTRSLWLNNHERDERYWYEMLKKGYGLDYGFFLDKRILEIGCGPAGIIFSIHNASYRIGIEPMDVTEFIHDPERKKIVQAGIGENLGFEDNFFDVVLCFNALDHTAKPSAVIKEVRRVLSQDGEFLLWLHALLPKYTFLKPLLNRLDSPHPHHFTAKEVIQMVTNEGFEIKYDRLFRGLGPVTRSSVIPHSYNIKSFLGNRMMEDLWLRLK